MPLAHGSLSAEVVRGGVPSFASDIGTDERFDAGRRDVARARGYRSIVHVPMLVEGRAIGTIAVTRRETGPFLPGEIALLQTFADQAVIAIENVRLFNETKEALERQTATSEILRSSVARRPMLSPCLKRSRGTRPCSATLVGARSAFSRETGSDLWPCTTFRRGGRDAWRETPRMRRASCGTALFSTWPTSKPMHG